MPWDSSFSVFHSLGLTLFRHSPRGCNQMKKKLAASVKHSSAKPNKKKTLRSKKTMSLKNSGQYDQSRVHLEKILKQNAKADFALYGLAVIDCLTGQVESSLKNLSEAIRLNPHNRFQARNDSDFQNMADDPRFTELPYPEPTETAPPDSDSKKS